MIFIIFFSKNKKDFQNWHFEMAKEKQYFWKEIYLQNYKAKKINTKFITKEEETKTKSNINGKNYSIKMNYNKSDLNENEQIKNISNNDMNIKDVYYNYNDDYKILYDNSDDKFDSDKFNNNYINKTFTDNNLKKSINKNTKIKLLGKKGKKLKKLRQ